MHLVNILLRALICSEVIKYQTNLKQVKKGFRCAHAGKKKRYRYGDIGLETPHNKETRASRRSQQQGMHSGTASEQHVSVLYFRPEPMSIFRSVHNTVAGLEVLHQLFEEPFFVFVFDVKCWVLVSPYSFPCRARVGEEP